MAKKDFDCYSMCLWQLKDDSWGGVFVDIIDQEVEHRSHIKVVVQQPPVTASYTEIASPTTQSGVEPQVSVQFFWSHSYHAFLRCDWWSLPVWWCHCWTFWLTLYRCMREMGNLCSWSCLHQLAGWHFKRDLKRWDPL